MNTFLFGSSARCGVVALLMLGLCLPAFAGPGAHGPDGEHLDSPGASAVGGAARPRIETKSELFELVGYLHADELSVMINRFETNEPVVEARLEVAMGSAKAVARFHSDHGDYAVDDAAFLKALSSPGEHPLIFTVIAGADSDLLEGTLTVKPAQPSVDPHGHSHTLEYALIAAGVLVVILGAVALWRRRARNRMRYATRGGLS